MSELDLSHLIFPVIGRDPNENRNAHLQEGFHDGEPIPGTKCMERGCYEPRWKHPRTGETVLCVGHLYLVVFCGRRVPPLRQGFDYQGIARRMFVTASVPDDPTPKPVNRQQRRAAEARRRRA